jgi:hypothetical protein
MAGEMTEPVVEMLQQGLTIMRAENETQQAMAVQRPREIQKLAQAAIEELRAFPAFAKRAYYSIPYKKRGEDGSYSTEIVEGLSIKAANALVRHWGNNASGFRVVGADEDRILIQGVFLDYETNMRRTTEQSVNRKFVTKDKKTITLDIKRLEMAIQAGGSKAVRNAITNSLPAGLLEGYFAEAKRIVAKGGRVDTEPITPQDIADVREKIFTAFARLTVEREEVVSYISRHPELETEEAVVGHLQGVLNAIEDGQTTVDDVFSVGQETPITQPQAKAAPGSAQGAAGARPAALPPFPAGLKEMDSKRASKCETCKKDIALGERIGYDPKIGRAHHRSHYA